MYGLFAGGLPERYTCRTGRYGDACCRIHCHASTAASRNQHGGTDGLAYRSALAHVAPEPFPSYLGVEINQFENLEWANRAVEFGVEMVRHNGVLWSEVEPEPGERRWEALAEMEPSLAYFGQNGVETILIVRSAPLFAQREPGQFCGPIAEEAFPAFAQFLGELVTRYSQPPYNVHYWELWNEPDVAVTGSKPDQLFGCWGDPEAADFGGGYYAEMLKWAYPAIKAADPQAQVLIGGLLLDCDPDSPLEGRTCGGRAF